MNRMDYDTTPLECDRRCWVYSNGNSITFREIEMNLKNRTKNMLIDVYGVYDKTNLSSQPMIIAKFKTKNGYVSTLMLEKNIFNRNNLDDYYDYLIRNITMKFAKDLEKITNKKLRNKKIALIDHINELEKIIIIGE